MFRSIEIQLYQIEKAKGIKYWKLFILQGACVTTGTSGNGHLLFGDNLGNAHLVNRQYDVVTFRAYETSLTIAQQVQNSTFLFTLGVTYFISSQ